jgi:7-keto-8-aminopelargonate synthetase-like enzyme
MNQKKVNLIYDIIHSGYKRGLTQQVTEDEFYDGRSITINGSKLINFGSCSYLGLEVDQRLKDAAIDAIQRFGIQYSSSRTYVSPTLNAELTGLVSQMFEAPVALTTSTSLAHHAVMPVIVDSKDAIILDQQVHASVQDAAIKLQAMGTKVIVIRHNDLDELKKK